MKVITSDQMVLWDQASQKKTSAQVLMGNAAKACLEELLKRKIQEAKKITLLAGPGNNGGDAFALALMLAEKKIPFEIFFFGKPDKLSQAAKHYYEKIKKKLRILQLNASFKKAIQQSDWIIDGLFGTGLKRSIAGELAKVIRFCNQQTAYRVAIDMPSGVSGNTGKVLGGLAFKAHLTLTFECPKWGQLKPEAWNFVGSLVVKSIGLEPQAYTKLKALAYFITQESLAGALPARSYDCHKRSVGKLLVLAGSPKMLGAGFLCALSAYRSGVGWLKWAFPASCLRSAQVLLPEAIMEPLAEEEEGRGLQRPTAAQIRNLCQDVDAILLGPGWSRQPTNQNWIQAFLQHCPKKTPLILDGDALYFLSKNKKYLKSLSSKTLLTPHLNEMAGLTALSLPEVLPKREELALNFSQKYKVHIILKGYRSLYAGPKKELFINSTGGPTLATAGSGDVLAGLCAGFVAQTKNLELAARLSLYLHGLAGDQWQKERGPRGLLAHELTEYIPKLLKKMLITSN